MVSLWCHMIHGHFLAVSAYRVDGRSTVTAVVLTVGQPRCHVPISLPTRCCLGGQKIVRSILLLRLFTRMNLIVMSGGFNIIGGTLEETILSSWRTANTLVTNAQCALHWDKDRCWHYDPKLDDHMVASSSISSLITLCRENTPCGRNSRRLVMGL